MKSNITQRFRKKAILFTLLSWTIAFVLASGLIIYGLTVRWTGSGEMSEKFKALIGLIGTSLLGCVVLSIIVKDKIKPVVWMINIILSAYLFNDYIMFAVFGIWIIDTYIISPLAKYYRNKHSINVEIDRRI